MEQTGKNDRKSVIK